MNDIKDFLRRASSLGADVYEDILSARTRELQRQLIVSSAIVVLVSLGVYSTQEVELGPALLVAKKSAWVTAFSLATVGYFLALYLVACWMDISRKGFAQWKLVERMEPLVKTAQYHFVEVNRIFAEMMEAADAQRCFLESKGLEIDNSSYGEKIKQLKGRIDTQLKLGQAKNRVLKDIARGSVWTRRFTVLLELFVPTSMAILAIGLALTTAKWEW